MEVALYKDHHDLPFWHEPRQPWGMFDIKMVDWLTNIGSDDYLKVVQNLMWPILLGLHYIDQPNIMAHVSFFCFHPKKKRHLYMKRYWVQFTTIPKKRTKTGKPIIVRGKKVQVVHLWGGDNGTYAPTEFLSEDERKNAGRATFWQQFFMRQLKQAARAKTKQAKKDIAEAQAVIDLYKNILRSK